MREENSPFVFLVEDNPFFAGALKYDISLTITKNVKVFSTGEECLRNICLNPDVVLLDYDLAGDLNGIGVLEKIKEKNVHIPVVFISACEKLEVAANALNYGAYDYIVKNELAFIRAKDLIGKIMTRKCLV
ncbi:MAG: response regulator [Flavobacteriales bacterium]|nr:MAG: response regulator [Flavobacteriales bacterium]